MQKENTMTIKQEAAWSLIRYCLRLILGTVRGGKTYDHLFLYVETGRDL